MSATLVSTEGDGVRRSDYGATGAGVQGPGGVAWTWEFL
jgi:hypothetical protein